MKKLLKLCLFLAAAAAILAAGGILVLKAVLTPEKIKQTVQTYVAQNFHREVTFNEAKLNFIGLTLTDFALSEENTFAQGTFVKAKQLVAKIAVKPLLKKRVEIDTLLLDGLDVQLVAHEDGTFNFTSLLSPADQPAPAQDTAPAQETPAPEKTDPPLVLQAKQVSAQNCALSYLDESSGDVTTVRNLQVTLTDFDLNAPFQAALALTATLTPQTGPAIEVPLEAQATVFLAGLDLPKASAQITAFQARYKNAVLNLQGQAENFTSPAISLSGTLSGVDGQTLADFAPGLAQFSMPALSFDARLNTQLDTSSATVEKAALTVGNSSLSAAGNLSWQSAFSYRLSGQLSADLAQLLQISGGDNTWAPQGVIDGTFTATEQKDFTDINSVLKLKNVRLVFEPWDLSDVNGTLRLASLDNLTLSPLTGKLNGEDFSASFAYKQAQQVTDLNVNLDLSKLTLTSFGTSETTADTSAAEPAQSAPATSASNTQRTNIKASVKVGGISVPYFRSNGLNLTANLTNLTDAMTQADGTVTFAFEPGAITNLNSLIGQNKWVKILFLPLTVVRSVSGALKLDLFPSEADGGSIAFTQAQGAYTFTNGVMNVDETVFKSTVTTLNAGGTVDFPQNALSMRATATLLTQAAPVVIKITGTPADPKGKLDVVNTIGSVVGGILSGKSEAAVAQEGQQAVSDTVTEAANTIKQIGNLFKKKK